MRNLALGLMSGTSMDGIDVAIIDVATHDLIHGATYDYPKHVTDALTDVMAGQAFDMHFFAKLHQEIGQAFGVAALDALNQLSSSDRELVKVIGHHGQTVCHQINPPFSYTWQMGCAERIATLCKLPVVFDFRTKNVVQGGQGAPLAPLYHEELFASDKPCAVVNIGGISNISILVPGQTPLGYDVGPGNCLMDAWITKHLKLPFDKDGHWAAQGRLNEDLLHQMLQDPYFKKSTPKSIGKEYFSLDWIPDNKLAPADIQATLLHLTALTIADEIKTKLPQHSPVYLCGGGVKNTALFETLKYYLLNHEVLAAKAAFHLEAMMMAWLGWMRLQGHLFNVSAIMGGEDSQLLGHICL